MTKKEDKRKKVEEVIACDEQRLNGKLGDVIAFLQGVLDEHPDKELYLSVDTEGYDWIQAAFAYERMETDEEMNSRLELEAFRLKMERDEARRKEERAKDKKEFDRLKRKHGF